ncbi:FtsW/RodA/SpoVE family cell cycle protein [Ammoniphilus sp. CFH 90114]|uniref:FtsW/RodA/SpoVE family cell cycle protein n=1 Tax=Ammoniphilus sp. CFH 90114 TaxID=2493665 RepID=UPI0013E9528A|nr:FtsW/RodA/SpoVE family cell cycle protein [Ammoniphilus sp. CFH 90114]
MISDRNRAAIEDYLDTVCSQIKNKEIHDDIRCELNNHIDEILEDYLAEGIEESEAIKQSLLHMGDPVHLGKQFWIAHKPKTEWTLLGLVTAFIGMGLLIMYSIGMNQANHDAMSLFLSKVLTTWIGIIALAAVFFFDYRKLKTWSPTLFLGTLVIMLLVLLMGPRVNGIPHLDLGFIRIDFIHLSPFCLIVFLAGILLVDVEKKSEASGQNKLLAKALLLLLVPSLFYLITPSLYSFLLYAVGFFVLFFTSKASRRQIVILLSTIFVLIVGLFLTMKPYQISRLAAFLDPYQDPQGSGYQLVQSIESIRSAGWLGHGFGAELKVLPGIQSDFVFTYLVYSQGWLIGGALASAVLFFMIRMIRVSQWVRDPYGRMMINGIASLFILCFLYSILMTVGLLPPANVAMPFVSHGGSLFLIHMISVGLILSIYRRKDLHPTRLNNESTTS